MPIHFTDLAIRNLAEGLYFDERTPSFGIRIGKHRRTWLVLKGENRTKVRLGHYPALSLAEARRKALVALGSPLEPANAPQFKEALDEFLDLHGATLKPRSKYEIERTLRRHFHWQKALDKITHNEVATVIDGIEAKSEAAHAFKDIRTFFNWCVPRYIPHSPCEGLKMPSRYVPRQRVLSGDELKRVWKAAGEIGYPFGTIVRLLILTGQRWGEVASLRWEFIDQKTETITLPETKNGRQHTFPYDHSTTTVLETIPRPHGTSLLFPGRTGAPWNGAGKMKIELDKRSGVSGFTIHDLRRTFATNLAALGTPIHITERLLNHVSGTESGIVSVYQRHRYEKECREAINTWTTRLKNLIS